MMFCAALGGCGSAILFGVDFLYEALVNSDAL